MTRNPKEIYLCDLLPKKSREKFLECSLPLVGVVSETFLGELPESNARIVLHLPRLLCSMDWVRIVPFQGNTIRASSRRATREQPQTRIQFVNTLSSSSSQA